MNERQSKLLQAIIDQFIVTAVPVGSKRLLESGSFCCSSATIRAEMGFLEGEGYLTQPHVSAGREPTAKGYRCYVHGFLTPNRAERAVRKRFESLRDEYERHKDQELVFDAVGILSRMSPNIAFATVPHKDRVYYLGLSNVLRQPEFQRDPLLASNIVEVLEDHMASVLGSLVIDEHIRYYIGDENILPQIESCAIMVIAYQLRGNRGVIGILGPMRMDYGYNTVALDLCSQFLH